MKYIKIVVGANYGDEGKGLATNYFTKNKENSVVVLSNGGSQRGHTVVTNSGIRHVFHHFGSGTFNGAVTYIPEDFILNPIVFHKEYDELKELGYEPKVFINPNCMITTPIDMMANQIIEESRGNKKHGSCGLGIFETIKRDKYVSRNNITAHSLRKYYFDIFYNENIHLTEEWYDLLFDDDIWENFLYDCLFMLEHSISTCDNVLKTFDNIVFENGQGILLDQNNREYFPHLTPSNTGIANPKKIIENVEWDDEIHVETCYVSRTYLTRHGAGPLSNECKKEDISLFMKFDQTNVTNPHQDTLRYGKLDIVSLYARCKNDVCDFGDKKSMMFTHTNEHYSMNSFQILLSMMLSNNDDIWNIYFSNADTLVGKKTKQIKQIVL